MTTPAEQEIDWSLCTWKGSRRKQHEDFHTIPFSRKLELIEEMNHDVRALYRAREAADGIATPIDGANCRPIVVSQDAGSS
jgi:hypothetical protein